MANTIESVYTPEALASIIVDKWCAWTDARREWANERVELRQYIFATDTRKTTNAKLPWKNSTVTPKLTQIRDNLHANYLAALFPREDWFTWESTDKSEELAKKREAIVNYMRNKLKASGFETIVSQLVYDYIDYGNVIVGHTYVNDVKQDEQGNKSILYVGPKAIRISPLDCVFDITASTFDGNPFIRRIVKSIGDLQRDIETNATLQYSADVLSKVVQMRKEYFDDPEKFKDDGLAVDGFGNLNDYFSCGNVELLEFWGDIYDPKTGTLYKDRVITIVDRKFVLRNIPNPSRLGRKPFFHCGWRLRPDNLMAQGPLDQLVGMQYRIDHLENLKADVFDQIAHPVVKVTGDTVEAFTWQPGEQIMCGAEGDVATLHPDTTALNADMQIEQLMNRMEELAGAPKQAMGIRTPGEKTKYEVQTLENAAGRIFQSKVSWFERNILEPLLNSMLEEAQRNFGNVERIKMIDAEFGTETYVEITKEDLTGTGHIYPIGARHFAEQARFVQELTQTLALVQQVPTVAVHISGKAVAKALEEVMGWRSFSIVKDNAVVFEQAETQRLMNSAQEDIQTEAQVGVNGEQGAATIQTQASI